MTLEEEITGLRKQNKAQQTLIHLQRAALTKQRSVRLALVAGSNVDQISPAVEQSKAAEFLTPAETFWSDLVACLRFYGAAANYRNNLGVPSLTAAVPVDAGAKARQYLAAIGQV